MVSTKFEGKTSMTRWQKFYLEDERVLSAPPSDCVRQAVDVFSKYDKPLILDLGCGVGRDSFHLAENGFSVVGVDLAESALTIANRSRNEKQKTIMLLRADARRLPFSDESFNGIYCFGLLHEFTNDTRDDDIRKVTNEIYRILKPSGVLVLTVLSGTLEEGLPHVYLFTEEMFDVATGSFQLKDKRECWDTGCTGKKDYKIWYGELMK